MADLSLDQTIIASDGPVADAYFGETVQMDSGYAVVGASGANSDKGAAYVLKQSGTQWTEKQILTAFDGASGDYYGGAVDISGDTIVVGAPWDDDTYSASGSVYIYTRSGETWSLQQKINATVPASGDNFGDGVAIDGDTLIAGAPGAGADGAAYIFTRTAGVWSEQQKLTPTHAGTADYFGFGVCIDGTRVAIVDPFDGEYVSYNGAVYIFDYSGGTWSQTARLVGSQGMLGEKDYLGYRGAITGQFRLRGDVLVVGAPGIASNDGRVYVFELSGTWSETHNITADTPLYSESKQFGSAVDYDGERILITDPYTAWINGVRDALGAIYVYEYSSDAGAWQQAYSLIGPKDVDWPWAFGGSACLSGRSILVGSMNVSTDVIDDYGEVYAVSIPWSGPLKVPTCGLYIDEVRGVKWT